MLPDKNGVYLAQPTSINIEEKSTGSVQANVSFNVVEYRGADGRAAEPADAQITAYMNLITKAGKLNEINARSFREAFGWDGASFEALASMDLAEVQVQIVVGDEQDQNGSTVKRVKYINPRDYTPGAQVTSDPAAVKSLDAKYGALLRATAGTPVGRSATSTKAPVKTAPASGASAVDLAKQTAYAKYISKVDAYGRDKPEHAYSNADRAEVFRTIATDFAKTAGKPDAKTLTAAEWAEFGKQIDNDFDAATRTILPF